MKDKNLHLTIMRYSMIEAIHWYVISSDDYKVHKKFNHFDDAKKYALTKTYKKNIEIIE